MSHLQSNHGGGGLSLRDVLLLGLVTLIFGAIIVGFFWFLGTAQTNIAEKVESIQLAEGESHTAMVEKVNVSDGYLIMDNGHKINTSNLPTQPSVGDTLEYVKTLGYNLDPRGTPKLNDNTAFINIEIIDK